MSIFVYRNAKLLVAGFDLSAEFKDLSLTYSAAMLDATTFGADTQIFKGGLYSSQLSGDALADFGALAPNLLYNILSLDDQVVSIFPNGITLGVACGYACKAVFSTFDLGGPVGSLESLKFTAESRGV